MTTTALPGTTDGTPVATFAAKLNDLFLQSGRGSLRRLAESANYSHSTFSRALAGRQFPTWDVVEAFVRACGADPVEWKPLWTSVRKVVRRGSSVDSGLLPVLNGITSADTFARQLRSLKINLGDPSIRTLARRCELPSSTVSDAFNPRGRLPNLHVVTRILTELGLDSRAIAVWAQAWKEVVARSSEPGPADGNGTHPLLQQADQLGLEAIFGTRIQALRSFVEPLEHEIDKGTRGRLWIMASSVKGLVQVVDRFDGMSIMTRALHNRCDVRLLCTDPRRGDERAAQEDRPLGAIHEEIRLSLVNLRLVGLKQEHVRYHRHSSTPTVFGICLADKMILNPYPYGSEAFKNFTIVARQTGNEELGIFEHYLQKHFERSWREGQRLDDGEWDRYRLQDRFDQTDHTESLYSSGTTRNDAPPP